MPHMIRRPERLGVEDFRDVIGAMSGVPCYLYCAAGWIADQTGFNWDDTDKVVTLHLSGLGIGIEELEHLGDSNDACATESERIDNLLNFCEDHPNLTPWDCAEG